MADLFVIYARDKADALVHRLAIRPKHLEHLAGIGERLKIAGAMIDETSGKPCGSVVIFAAENLAAAEAFAKADPFATGGVFEEVTVSQWRPSVGAWMGKE